jgi:quercetin dioxygenase-like cupin family protein
MSDVSASYFAQAEGTPDAPGRFVSVESDAPKVEFLKGLSFNPVVGQGVMANFVRFEPHTEAPRHMHSEEQMTIVIEGELEFEFDDETRILRPGEMAVIPPFVPHAARTHDQPSLEIDVFSPPRQALLDLLDQQSEADTAP